MVPLIDLSDGVSSWYVLHSLNRLSLKSRLASKSAGSATVTGWYAILAFFDGRGRALLFGRACLVPCTTPLAAVTTVVPGILMVSNMHISINAIRTCLYIPLAIAVAAASFATVRASLVAGVTETVVGAGIALVSAVVVLVGAGELEETNISCSFPPAVFTIDTVPV